MGQLEFTVQAPEVPFDRASATAALKAHKILFHRDERARNPGETAISVCRLFRHRVPNVGIREMKLLRKFTLEGKPTGLDMAVDSLDELVDLAEQVAPLSEWSIATPQKGLPQ